MDAGGARHLRQALDGAFDLLAGNHHQIGHLIDDDDDVRHRRKVDFLLLEKRFASALFEAGLHGHDNRLALVAGSGGALIVAVDVAHTSRAILR